MLGRSWILAESAAGIQGTELEFSHLLYYRREVARWSAGGARYWYIDSGPLGCCSPCYHSWFFWLHFSASRALYLYLLGLYSTSPTSMILYKSLYLYHLQIWKLSCLILLLYSFLKSDTYLHQIQSNLLHVIYNCIKYFYQFPFHLKLLHNSKYYSIFFPFLCLFFNL